MVKGPGLDRLELIFPGETRLKPKFAEHWNSPVNDRIFKMSSDAHYMKTGDLRGIGLDARLACGNRHYFQAGPKLTIFRMGEKAISEVIGIAEEIFDTDIWKASMPRVDLTADTEGVTVNEFEQGLYVLHKQTSQTEYGETDKVDRAYRRGKAESIYFGRGKGQVRIYNKTEEREMLLRKLNRAHKRHNKPIRIFQEEYGYDPLGLPRTRVEKQCGGRLAEDLWGIRYLGDIHRLADVDPFANFRFACDLKQGKALNDLDDSMRAYILLLRRMAIERSLADVDLFLKQTYRNPENLKKFKQRYRTLYTPEALITRQSLTEQYRRSIIEQLAA